MNVSYVAFDTTTGEIVEHGFQHIDGVNALVAGNIDVLTDVVADASTHYVDINDSNTLKAKVAGTASVDDPYPDINGVDTITISNIPNNATVKIWGHNSHAMFPDITEENPLEFTVNDNVAVLLCPVEEIFTVRISSVSTLDQDIDIHPQYPDDEEIYFQWLGEVGPVGLTFDIVEG